MFLAPCALALLLTPDLSAVSARFGTPAMVLPCRDLFLTSDGKLATDGETWIDLATEKTVSPAVPGVSRRLQLLLGDGNFVFDGLRGVTLHSGKTGERLAVVEMEHNGRFAIAPSGRRLASVEQLPKGGCRVQLADWPTGNTPPAWSTLATSNGRVEVVEFNSSGSHIIWMQVPLKGESGEPTFWVCDVSTGKAVRLQLDPAHRRPAGLAVSADGKWAAVVTTANTDVFDVTTGELLRAAPHPERQMHYGHGIPQPTFTPDGKHLLACRLHAGKLSRIPTDPAAEVGFVDVSDGDKVEKFVLTPDGERAVLLDESGVVRLYDVRTGKRIDAGTHDTWTGVAWAGEHRAVCWSDRGRVATWDTRTGKLEKDWLTGKPAADSVGVGGVKVSADGRLMAVAEYGPKPKRLRVFDLSTGKAVLELPEKYAPAEVAFHPDGDRIGVGTVKHSDGRSRMTFRVFTLADGRERTIFVGPAGLPAFTPDGRSVLMYNGTWQNDEPDDRVRCIETVSGGTRWTWKGTWDNGLADGTGYVGTTSDGTPFAACGGAVRGFDPLTGKARWVIDRPGLDRLSRPQYAASPDGRWLAVTAAVDGLEPKSGGWFELYDLDYQTGRDRPLVSPVLRGTTFRGVAVSGDGTQVLTLSDTGEQMVWEVGKLRPGAADPWRTVWADLAADAGEAATAMTTLAADPKQTVKLLSERLPPTAEANADDVKRWIGELGSPDFRTRQEAERQLGQVADVARKWILTAAENPPSAEAGSRLDRLVAKIDHFAEQPDSLRVVRAVEVVERLRTPAAVKLLERWAGGAPDALLTTEAKASLKRIKK